MIYRCKHFNLVELVGPQIFKDRGEKAWNLLNPLMLEMLDLYREDFGPIIINDWYHGGTYKESGLRDFSTSTGSTYSMHKYGCAFDCKPKQITNRQMYERVLANPDRYKHVNRVENIQFTPTWFHSDGANTEPGKRILVVNP